MTIVGLLVDWEHLGAIHFFPMRQREGGEQHKAGEEGNTITFIKNIHTVTSLSSLIQTRTRVEINY